MLKHLLNGILAATLSAAVAATAPLRITEVNPATGQQPLGRPQRASLANQAVPFVFLCVHSLCPPLLLRLTPPSQFFVTSPHLVVSYFVRDESRIDNLIVSFTSNVCRNGQT